MGNEVVSWELRIDGAQQASRNIGTVGTSFDQLDKKTREATTRFTGVASAGSALGSALSRLNPQVGTLVSAFGSAGGAASGLTTAIGGIGGLVGGGLVAAVAVAIQYFFNVEQQTKATTQALEDNETAVENLTRSYKLLDETKARESRRALGVATEADLEAKRAEKQIERDSVLVDLIQQETADVNTLTTAEKMERTEAIANLNFKLSRRERELEVINAQIEATKRLNVELDIEEAIVGGDGPKAGGRAGRTIERVSKAGRNVQMEQQVWLDRLATERDDAEQKRLDDWYAIEVEKAEARFEWHKSIEEKITEAKEKELQKRLAAEQKQNDIMISMGQRYMDITANTMAAGLNALAQGKELAIGQIISAIGSELVAAGTRDVMQAAAFFFNPYMMGFAPGLMAAGLAEIGVGMGMGAAGAAATPSKGKMTFEEYDKQEREREADARQRQKWDALRNTQAPANPMPAAPEESERRTEPVTIHVHTLKADEDAGKVIQESWDKYKKRHGKAASLGGNV